MASVIALRALVSAGLGLGALDLVWINAGLAPALLDPPSSHTVAVAMPNEPEPAPAEAPPPVPAAPVAPAPVIDATPDPVEAVSERVYFTTNSADLGVRGKKTLAKLVELAGPTAEFSLEGHADYRGDEASNRTLSRDRATTVQKQLVHLGVDRTRIHVGFVGEGDASGDLWRDRRVEIQITGGTR